MTPVPPGFALTVTPNPVSLKPGSTGVLLATVQTFSGFNQPVTLSCTGTDSSNELGCAFLEPTLPGSGGATTLDLTTTAPYPCGGSPTKPYLKQAGFLPSCAAGISPDSSAGHATQARAWWAFAFGVPTVASLMLIGGRRRTHWVRLMALMMLAGVVGLSGCGNCSNLGTEPGHYEVTVIATAGSVSHSVVVKLTVLDP
jgi:hypothetical protein